MARVYVCILFGRPTRTLNSALGTSGGHGTHGTDHEVGEELVGVTGGLGDIFAKVGDLAALGAAVLEGAAVVGVGRGGRVGADRGGAEGSSADRRHLAGSRGAQADARCVCERRHRGIEGVGWRYRGRLGGRKVEGSN